MIDSPTYLNLRLSHVREFLMRNLRPALNRHNVTEQQWRVIHALSHHGAMEFSQLAHHCCIIKASFSSILVRMESVGYISRKKSNSDRRRIIIALKKPGADLFLQLSKDMAINQRELKESLGDQRWSSLLLLIDELDRLVLPLESVVPSDRHP
ncbi:Organic hydroperoxide resistance transcriptional regulator [compost metagenome]